MGFAQAMTTGTRPYVPGPCGLWRLDVYLKMTKHHPFLPFGEDVGQQPQTMLPSPSHTHTLTDAYLPVHTTADISPLCSHASCLPARPAPADLWQLPRALP